MHLAQWSTSAQAVADIANGKESQWFASSPSKFNVSFQDYLGMLHDKAWRGVVSYRAPRRPTRDDS